MEDMYSILAAKWYPQAFAQDPRSARVKAKARILGNCAGAADPTEELTDQGMNVLCDVIAAAVQRRDAEERINGNA